MLPVNISNYTGKVQCLKKVKVNRTVHKREKAIPLKKACGALHVTNGTVFDIKHSQKLQLLDDTCAIQSYIEILEQVIVLLD